MKTLSFSSFLPSLVNKLRPQSLYQVVSVLLVMGLILLNLLLTTACKHYIDPEKRPGPGTGSTQPDNTTSTPSGSSTGNNGPVNAFRRFRITYASSDFQEVQYDAADQPVYYCSQATTVLGGNGMVQQRQFQ